MSAANSNSDLGALFDGHIAREFADFDVDATMETMVAEPYVHCVATLAGGFGGREVRRFYNEHFINQIPKDAKVTPISRTVGKDQVVDELIVSFTHNTQWDYLLPGIPPTGKKVELPHVVVMKFENGKVAHEHVCGTRPRCLCRWGCWIRGSCRWSGSNRPSSCCASHTDVKMSRQLRRSGREKS